MTLPDCPSPFLIQYSMTWTDRSWHLLRFDVYPVSQLYSVENFDFSCIRFANARLNSAYPFQA